MKCFSLTAFKIFNLCLVFSNFTMICIDGDFYVCLLRVFWALCMCRFMLYTQFVKFSVIITSSIFPAISLFCDSHYICLCLMLSHRSLRLCWFFFNVFPLSSSYWIVSMVYLQVNWFFCHLKSIHLIFYLLLMLSNSRIFINLFLLYLFLYWEFLF